MPYTDSCHLIISADEIILLKVGDKIIVNKYTNHPSRNLFPYSEKEQIDCHHFTQLFEYNKTYLNFRASVRGLSAHQEYFFKGSNRALWLTKPLSIDDRNQIEDSVELSRQEIEEIFNSNNYDSIYVIDKSGIISFARNDKDKVCIGKKVIPSDEEIVEMELSSRKQTYRTARMLNPQTDTTENYEKANTPRTIDEIRDFQVCGPMLFSTYSHMLLTVKDGQFDLKWFKIDFIEKNRFRLTISPITIVEPTIEDVLSYSGYIHYTPEPSQPSMLDQPQKSFSENHTEGKDLKKTLR